MSDPEYEAIMLPRWARLVFAIATTLVVWLATAPARAAIAPQCDPRGAITFAPPPQLQPPMASIDVDDAPQTCIEKLVTDAGLEQGATPILTTSPEPATLAPMPCVSPAGTSTAPPAVGHAFFAPSGMRARLDRPPRV